MQLIQLNLRWLYLRFDFQFRDRGSLVRPGRASWAFILYDC